MPPSYPRANPLSAVQAAGTGVHVATTMLRRGLLMPGRPDRLVRQVSALARWGLTLAGGYISATRRDPLAPAVCDTDGTLTFGELDTRTDQLAHALAGYGEHPRVGLLCHNHRGILEVMIAGAKIGADIVLLNTGMSAPQLRSAVEDHRLSLLVIDEEFSLYLGDVDTVVDVAVYPDGDEETSHPTVDEIMAHADTAPPRPPRQRGRTIVLTSGTTGKPKGARRPQPALRSLTAILSRIPLRVGDRTAILSPMFHTWGYAAVQLSMAMRATVVLSRRFDPEETLALIARHRCRVVFAVPIMLQRILELPDEVRARYDLSCVEIVATSGSRLPGELSDRFMDAYGDVLYNLYGTTEVSWITIATPAELRRAPGTAGRPPRGTRVVLRGEDGEPVAPGDTGRICAGNEMLYEGYTDGSRRRTTAGTMDSGDVGHFDSDGLLFIDGRADDMIVSGGENVFPREVEDLLASLDEVREAAVIGVDDERFGQRLAAYVVLREGSELDAEQIRAVVKERLARFSVPRDVRFLKGLPRNATGKVVPGALPR